MSLIIIMINVGDVGVDDDNDDVVIIWVLCIFR